VQRIQALADRNIRRFGLLEEEPGAATPVEPGAETVRT
jgi:hypothetical protein